ncbi:MAG TPA: ubiquinol-cytochrome C chaperone family protein [Pseudolabrys sp.]|nr:ubiquinol-cytochrome C chaperone family protein [Pseudolabrys sp.]
MAQARLPVFYREYGVADTVNGRFDLLVLHLALVLDRMAQDPQLLETGQALFDHFCSDMDHNLREMGVGDLSVPRQMRRVGEAYYGRAKAYRAALAHGSQDELADALKRNIDAGREAGHAAVTRLAAYIMEAVGHLREQPAAQLATGALRLPDPATTVFVEAEPVSTKA